MSMAKCPHCNARLGGSSDAACPACLMKLALERGPAQMDSLAPTEPRAAFGADAEGKLACEMLARDFPELEILGLLGRGGMGAVFQARQRDLDRLVALKVIKPEVANVAGFAERFAFEARILARLNHPQVVTIHDFGRRGGVCFLLMEHVDGTNLRELMQGKKLPPAQALEIVPRLCEALQYAHDEGVVHRDIKPENILIDGRGRIKIVDFGLAKIAGTQPPELALTGSRQVLGTPGYMAPEQRQGSGGVDHRADLYALGVVFYEMLTGELPLGRFEPPSHRAELDVRLDPIVLKSLERDPARRYQHASDVKTDLEAVALGESTIAGPTAQIGRAVTPSAHSSAWSNLSWIWQEPRRVPRRWRYALGIVAAGLCLFFFLGLTSYSQGRLVEAAKAGDIRAVQICLAVGVDADARSAGGESALFLAAGEGHSAVVARLLRAGARVDTANSAGITPLMWAAWQGRESVVRILLNSHAEVGNRSLDGETALHKAAFRGHTAVVRNLIESGAILDESDVDGETALILAVAQGHLPTVSLLLGHHADPKAATRDGWTPLMVAARGGHESLVEALLPVSRVSAVTSRGETALDVALANGRPSIVEQLLAAGAEETGALWLCRGLRLARAGQVAEAILNITKATMDTQSEGKVWSFKIDDVQYTLPQPACSSRLLLGTYLGKNDRGSEAAEAYGKALDTLPSRTASIVLFSRNQQVGGRSETVRFEVRRDEIQRHVQEPDRPWRVAEDRELRDRLGGTERYTTEHHDRELAHLFE